jgi:Glycosyl transferase family 2
MPRVTICIPTYDRTQWLARAIESSLAQTFGDLVVEVHDDATPGEMVAEVVARFDDPRLRYVRHERNAGIVGNFTRSLLGADGEYVLQLGDDDEAEPTLVEATVAALDAHPTAGVAHSRFALIDAEGNTIAAEQDWLATPPSPLEPGHEFVRRSMVHGCRVCSSTALIRRAAVPDGAFRQEDFPPFDLAFWLRMAEDWDVAFVAEPLCRYRVHTQSHTSALSEIADTGYVQEERMMRAVHAVGRRHAATVQPPERRAELERLADRALRRGLVARVRHHTLPERPLARTARELASVARREPALLREPTAWLLLAGSIVGSRGVERLKGRT